MQMRSAVGTACMGLMKFGRFWMERRSVCSSIPIQNGRLSLVCFIERIQWHVFRPEFGWQLEAKEISAL